jgi:hypothetical protein
VKLGVAAQRIEQGSTRCRNSLTSYDFDVGKVYAAHWRRAAVLDFVMPGFESMRVQPTLWTLWLQLGGGVDWCDGVLGWQGPTWLGGGLCFMRRAAADVWGVLGQQPATCTTLLGK